MKLRFSKLAALSILITAGHLQAADLTVRGVITPPACDASFSGGGVLDWGAIPHSTLSATTFNVLPAKQATLQINCEQGTKTHVAFWATDANASSAIPGVSIEGFANGNDPDRIFGIGIDPVTNNKIGNFTLIGKTSSYDSTVNSTNFGFAWDATHTVNSFGPWLFVNKAGLMIGQNEERTVLTNDVASIPAAATNFTYTFDVVPQLNTATQITSTQEVPFEGTATFYVRYF